MLNAKSSLGLINASYQHYHATLPCLTNYFVVGAESWSDLKDPSHSAT